MKNIIRKNKKAWVKILEAFLSIFLIVGVLSIIMTRDNVQKQEEIANQIKSVENSVLQKVQINESVREDILNVTNETLESNEYLFPESLINLTNSSISLKLNCSLKICAVENECLLNEFPSKKEIYSSSSIISANKNLYNPKKLSIFCWRN